MQKWELKAVGEWEEAVELAAEGWELVAVHGDYSTKYFKRPLAAEDAEK